MVEAVFTDTHFTLCRDSVIHLLIPVADNHFSYCMLESVHCTIRRDLVMHFLLPIANHHFTSCVCWSCFTSCFLELISIYAVFTTLLKSWLQYLDNSFQSVILLQNCTVDLPGGPLQIEWKDEDNHVYMTGSAELVYYGSLPLWNTDSPWIILNPNTSGSYELLNYKCITEVYFYILVDVFTMKSLSSIYK